MRPLQPLIAAFGLVTSFALATDRPTGPAVRNWLTFTTDQAYRYRIQYPSEAIPDTTNPSAVSFVFRRLVKGLGDEPADTGEYALYVVVTPNPRRFQPARWITYLDSLNHQIGGDPRPFTDAINRRNRTRVDGRRALSVQVLEGDETTEYTFVEDGGFMYEIRFPISTAPMPEGFASLSRVFRAMVGSFRCGNGGDR